MVAEPAEATSVWCASVGPDVQNRCGIHFTTERFWAKEIPAPTVVSAFLIWVVWTVKEMPKQIKEDEGS